MMTMRSDVLYGNIMNTYDFTDFDGVCLSGLRTDDNTGASMDALDGKLINGYLYIVVQPENPAIANLGDPRKATTRNEAIETMTRYKHVYYARSENKVQSGQRPLYFGQKIKCKWLGGSMGEGNQRQLVFEQPIFSDLDDSFDVVKKLGFIRTAKEDFEYGTSALLGNFTDGPYKDLTIEGSVFPDDPIRNDLPIRLRKEMVEEYLPALETVMAGEPKGLKLLATAQAIKEGFYRNTRSYRFNNPGNIGNKDDGTNVGYPTLEDGIRRQRDYLKSVAAGRYRAYPLNKTKRLKPFFSEEIAKYQKSYKGRSPYTPGYTFVYTGQLDQFVKIYATASRSSNGYLNMILSYFSKNGIQLTPESKIQDIIKLN
tara:strand:+ start:1276 stop:2385 length:1110 start_codon:yes stop_codon:yes gene_type:complete